MLPSFGGITIYFSGLPQSNVCPNPQHAFTNKVPCDQEGEQKDYLLNHVENQSKVKALKSTIKTGNFQGLFAAYTNFPTFVPPVGQKPVKQPVT
jgi:hypothetical protein